MKRALITGITGQDGSYLAELLLGKGYEVHGTARRASNTWRIDHLLTDPELQGVRIFLHRDDMSDSTRFKRLLCEADPEEIYHLAAESHVGVSYNTPERTAEATAVGTVRLLESIRESGIRPRLYQASSSEMFGKPSEVPQRETTPMQPRSPYGCAKTYAHWMAVTYRESYDMFNYCGILYNHESPRRGESYVTRKISKGVARIKAGLQKELCLGNLDSRRDWGYAKDYVEAMWLMLQQSEPDDYLLATGAAHSVREFVEAAFSCADLDWEEFVQFDSAYERPIDVVDLVGDATKAEKVLGWTPQTNFPELVQLMVEADLESVCHGVGVESGVRT